MHIIYPPAERDLHLSRIRVALNSSGLWIEAPEPLTMVLRGPLTAKYHLGNEVYEFWVQTNVDGDNSWSTKLYHGDRRCVTIKRNNITGFNKTERDTLRFGTGRPVSARLDRNGLLNIQVPHAGPLPLLPDTMDACSEITLLSAAPQPIKPDQPRYTAVTVKVELPLMNGRSLDFEETVVVKSSPHTVMAQVHAAARHAVEEFHPEAKTEVVSCLLTPVLDETAIRMAVAA